MRTLRALTPPDAGEGLRGENTTAQNKKGQENKTHQGILLEIKIYYELPVQFYVNGTCCSNSPGGDVITRQAGLPPAME